MPGSGTWLGSAGWGLKRRPKRRHLKPGSADHARWPSGRIRREGRLGWSEARVSCSLARAAADGGRVRWGGPEAEHGQLAAASTGHPRLLAPIHHFRHSSPPTTAISATSHPITTTPEGPQVPIDSHHIVETTGPGIGTYLIRCLGAIVHDL